MSTNTWDNKKWEILWNEFIYTQIDNWDKIDQFLEKHKVPQLIQFEIDNLNIHVTIKGIEVTESRNKYFLKKSPGPIFFSGEFYQKIVTTNFI